MKLNKLGRMTAVLATLGLVLTACGSDEPDTGSNGDNGGNGAAEEESYAIGISQYVSHPSLDEAKEGFMSVFEDEGIDVDWDEQNAQADQATVNSISGNFAAADLDLVLAIATPSAITAATTINDKPILFTAVTDPVAANLADSWEEPGGNITGVSDMNPVKEQLELITQISPDAKKVGIIYSSAEANSVVQVEAAQEAADELGLDLQEVAITNSSEVQQGVQSFADVDAIYVPTDNTVVSGLEAVLAYGIDHSIPVIAAESDSVERGAIATYGINYRALGEQTGQMALRILRDDLDPGTVAVETAPEESLVITVNTEAAEQMGVELPEDLLAEATIVGDDAE